MADNGLLKEGFYRSNLEGLISDCSADTSTFLMFALSHRNEEEHPSGRSPAPGGSSLATVTHRPFFNLIALPSRVFFYAVVLALIR